jgi:EAL domain-containing protein (putative c-di-GMP-specific phosphodiesterase class I)
MSDAAGHGEAVERILDFARRHLEMDVAWMSEFVGGRQVFQRVSAGPDQVAPKAGTSTTLVGSYCARVLDGRLRSLIPNARRDPVSRDLLITEELNIGAYIGAPIYRSAGQLHGMLCCISHTPRTDLGEREAAIMGLMAQMLGDLTERSSLFGGSARDRRERIVAAIAGHGRHLALQPIVDIRRGVAVAVEALSRFDSPPAPDGWFADAVSVKLGVDLELACAQSALDVFGRADLPDLISVNLSPEALLSPECAPLLEQVDRSRLIIEITEHAPVDNYAGLTKALAPHREAGALVAIDDAGAGYASFRHILRLTPSFIKVDIALIRDIDKDPVRQALITALSSVADTAGARLIAEGIETEAELDTLLQLGVTLAQGYLLCRPTIDPLPRSYRRASPSPQRARHRD